MGGKPTGIVEKYELWPHVRSGATPVGWNRENGLNVVMVRHPRFKVAMAVITAILTFPLPLTSSWSSAFASRVSLQPLIVMRVPSSGVLYVLGNTGCVTSSCVHLVRTNDALSSYTTLALPPVSSVRGVPSGSLGQMVFATAHDGYALDEVNGVTTLYVTHDGARSWHRQVVSNDLTISDLAASESTVYVVAMRCAKQGNGNMGCTHYELFRTDLAAKHWTATSIPNGDASPWDFMGKPAVFDNKIWISEQTRTALLVSSKDGGKSFKSHRVPIMSSVAGCSLGATSATSLWAECPTGMMASFFFSSDAGRSWRSVLGPQDPQFAGTGGGAFDPVSPDLAYIDFGQTPRTNNVFRVSTARRELMAVGTLTCPEVLSMVFTSRENGLALCSDFRRTHFERSTDGGVHWRRFVLR
ncbi:MAG: beta propeller repeat protein [Acidimicrobiales bacterium]